MSKPTISWYALWKRLGKQPLNKTRGRKVKVLCLGKVYECRLEFTYNGSDFILVAERMCEE